MKKSLAFVLLMTACGPDEALVAEKAELEVKLADSKKSIARLERETRTQEKRMAKLEQELKKLKKEKTYRRLGIKPEAELHAVLQTSLGDIRCKLWPNIAPKTVLNFVELAEGHRAWTDPETSKEVRRPLYNGTIFHRVIPEFMIQGGDPLGTGAGGPGYEFEDELSPEVRFEHPGALAMANQGPATNGSQFFVAEGTPEHLNGKHTIFGQCAESMDVVRSIARVPRDKRDRPKREVVLQRVRILRPEKGR